MALTLTYGFPVAVTRAPESWGLDFRAPGQELSNLVTGDKLRKDLARSCWAGGRSRIRNQILGIPG